MSLQLENKYKWLSGAMYPPELEWLRQRVKESGAEILIECGRQDGASARWFHENLPGVKIYSIDLDDRPDILANSKKNLEGTNVEAITGDVFVQVPAIIRANSTQRIAIVEDAVKGWPGLCMLLSTVFYGNVVLVAEHNLHEGHRTRSFWKKIGGNNVFLEDSADVEIAGSLKKWIKANTELAGLSCRATEVSSLGIIQLTEDTRTRILDEVLRNLSVFSRWNPLKFRACHGGNEAGFSGRNFKMEYYFRILRPRR